MVVPTGRFVWGAHDELSSHAQMNKPHLTVIQVHLEVLAAALYLTNGMSSQGGDKIRSQGPAQARLAHLDCNNGLTDDQPLKTAPHGFHFRQFRHSLLLRRAPVAHTALHYYDLVR
jgi:hypothetical protein